MRLDAVKLALPSWMLTNDDVVGLVRHHSATTFTGDLDRMLGSVRALLRRSGAEQRYWRAPTDAVLPLVASAVDQAVETAGYRKDEIDLLICASVDRGFIEPATAYLVAQALEMDRVACFDIVDACNGWARALQVLFALFRSGAYQRAVIINAEFPMFDGGPVYPRLFSLGNGAELARSFAGYTLGEGVTATVVSADPAREWEFHTSSRPDLADLSTLPLPGYERYCRPSGRIERRRVGQFSALSAEMFAEANREVARLFQCLRSPVRELRAVFPHGATRRRWDDGAALLGVRHLLYHTYPCYGNLVSASIPAGIATAIDAGDLRRGDRVAVCGASAGMAFSVCAFEY